MKPIVEVEIMPADATSAMLNCPDPYRSIHASRHNSHANKRPKFTAMVVTMLFIDDLSSSIGIAKVEL